MRSRWPILALLCVLASLLVPGIASASTVVGAETRVWAFDLADQVRVGVERSLTLELHRGCGLTYDQIASDSLLAARGGGMLADDAGTGRRFIVDPKGNTLIEPPGGATVGNPAGTFVETRYPNGSPYQQLHSPRGEAPHGHGFLEGAGPNQRGPSLDVHGSVVPDNAPAAHWPVNQ